MEKVKENYPKWIFNQLKAEDDAKNPKNYTATFMWNK